MNAGVGLSVGVVFTALGIGGLIWSSWHLLPRAPGRTSDAPSVVAVAPMPGVGAAVAASSGEGAPLGTMVSAQVPVLDASVAATQESDGGTTADAWPRVTFVPGSAALDRTSLEHVKQISNKLVAHPEWKATVVGHGDRDTEFEVYRHLGTRRAGEVIRVLMDYGVSRGRIGAQAPGRSEPGMGGNAGTVQVLVSSRFAGESGKGAQDGR